MSETSGGDAPEGGQKDLDRMTADELFAEAHAAQSREQFSLSALLLRLGEKKQPEQQGE